MSNKLTGVIIGHSFVARLDNALLMERPAGCIVPQQLLTPVQLEVDDIYKHIYIEGRSGAKIGSLTQAVDLTGSLRRPNVVMFMAGSNDLCDAGADPMQVATDLLSLMDYMQTAYDVPLVVCCGAVPRDRCRDITAEEFRTRACTFNKCLRQGCPPGSGRKYVSFKGFWSDGPQGNPLPVAAWSADGIHPGPDVASYGFHKFRRNVRKFLLSAAAEHNNMVRHSNNNK